MSPTPSTSVRNQSGIGLRDIYFFVHYVRILMPEICRTDADTHRGFKSRNLQGRSRSPLSPTESDHRKLEEGTEPASSKPSRGHVLVVDDLEANRALIAATLSRDGYQVT